MYHHSWPVSYTEARLNFTGWALACDARQSRHPIPKKRLGGEYLSIDVATLGARNADHLVVVTSGVHGVEGKFGSVVQTEALRRLAITGLPPGVGVVMIHAVNPWGFVYSRRVDANNVDLNRNFIDSASALPETHPAYPSLDRLINPAGTQGLTDELQFRLASLRKIVLDRGTKRLAAAIAQGQYTHPKGLFFGGSSLSVSSHRLQGILSQLIDDSPAITHLDIHSGLGRSGKITLIAAASTAAQTDGASQPLSTRASTPATTLEQRVQQHYGLPCVADDRPGNPYEARGSLARWCTQRAHDKHYVYLCVEVGTVGPLNVLSALRRENRAYHHLPEHSPTRRRASQALCLAFTPESARWANNSVEGALDVIRRSCLSQLPLPGRG